MVAGRRARWALVPSFLLLLSSLIPPSASAQAYSQRSFPSGSLIIPMDIDSQDLGMLQAFGLVDALLRQGIPIWWCINPIKVYGTPGDVDFTAPQVHDLQSNAITTLRDYRGGPFVVDAGDASRAVFYVQLWQASHPNVKVHVVDATFFTPYWQVLTASPRIAVLASAKQSAVFSYLNAAGIPDENRNAWSGSSADVLSASAITGGALVDATGSALYNALLMPGLDVPDPSTAITGFVNDPVLLFAEDAAATQVESSDLLTTSGVVTAVQPASVQYGSGMFSPFFQMDARPTVAFQPDPGGDSFSLFSVSGNFYDSVAQMLQGTGAPSGHQDVWVAGFAKGTCTDQQLGSCTTGGPKGHIAYLGGFYTTDVPISTHPLTQGARLFFDALFAGSCTVAEAQPSISASVAGPSTITTPLLTVSVDGGNSAHVSASNFVVTYQLPPGAQFVSATGGGVYSSGSVQWFLARAGYQQAIGGNVTMTLPTTGSYTGSASVTYQVGNTPGFRTPASTLQTQFTCANPGLVALWSAEGNADDVSGNNHNGALQNGATYAPGKVGMAFSLNGVNANVAVPDDPALHFSNAMSVEGWINTTAGTDRYIATKHEDSFYFSVGGGSVAPHMLSFWLNGVSSSWFTGSTPVDDGQWHHVAATYDGSTMRLYVDGHLDASAPRTGTIQSGTSGLLIGARSDGTNASNFPGTIDELAVYNRAISPAEVQALDAMDEPCAAVSVGDAPSTIRALELSNSWPNPATRVMNFEFRIAGAAAARAEIIDVAGRRVSRPLKEQLLPGGTHHFQWDGLDESGARVAAGVYLIRVTSGTASAVQRIVLVR